MQRQGSLLAALLSLLLGAASADASTLVYSHVGDTDPTTLDADSSVENWTLQVGNATRGPLANDQGLAAWFVNDTSGMLSPTLYSQSTTLHTAAAGDGWTLRATLRVDADTDTPDCAISLESSVGGRRFFVGFGSSGGQTLYLQNACSGAGLAADVPGGPPTAYRTYELVWDPTQGAAGEADVYIDGFRQAAASGWAGTATASLERVVFGANHDTGQGQGNYHRVEWEVGEQACRDGIDNDGDGDTDYAGGAGDPGCESGADPSERKPDLACDDGADNDMDGLTDLADPGCASNLDDSEIIQGPALFSGTLRSVQGAPWTPPASVTLSASGSLSVIRSSPATFTIPAGAFVLEPQATTFANSTYKNLFRTFSRSQAGAGYFSVSYRTPGVTLSSQGVRLKLGPNGFGGKMPVSFKTGSYGSRFVTGTLIGTVTLSRIRSGQIGLGPLGANSPLAVSGTAAGTLYAGGFTPLQTSYSTLGSTIRGPWITGTVTAALSTSGVYTFRTAMGSDVRNGAGTSGTISLVTPHLTILTAPRFDKGTALTSKLTLSFAPAPEPARLILLASGLLGLSVLSRLRGRNPRQG